MFTSKPIDNESDMFYGDLLENYMELKMHSVRELVRVLSVETFHDSDDSKILQKIIDNTLPVNPTVKWDEPVISEPFLAEVTTHNTRVDKVPSLVNLTREYECVQVATPFTGDENVFDLNPSLNNDRYTTKPSFRWKKLSVSGMSDKALIFEVRTEGSITSRGVQDAYRCFKETIDEWLSAADGVILRKTKQIEIDGLPLVKKRRERYRNIRKLRNDLRDADFRLLDSI